MADIPFLSGLFEKLEDYQREVVDDKMKGHGLRTANDLLTLGGRTPVTGYDPLSQVVRGLVPQDRHLKYANGVGMTGKAWVDEVYKDSPWQDFAASLLVDPSNLIGLGLPGKVATALPAGSKLAKGLSMANKVDQLPGQVTGKTLGFVGDLGRGALKTTADAVTPHIPQHPLLDKFGAGIDKGMSAWREQALLSPAFHVNNWLGNVALPAQKGEWGAARAAALGPITGRNRQVTDVLGKLGNHRAPLSYGSGTPPPIDPASFNARWGDNMQKLGREANVNNPFSGPSVARDLPDTVGPVNFARDKYAGLSEASKRFGQERIEGPGLDQAFQEAFGPAFKQTADEFYKDLQRVRVNGKRPKEAQAAIDAFKASRGQMSPDDLREILNPGTRARRAARAGQPYTPPTGPVTTNWKTELVKNWEDRVIGSVEAGTKKSTDIFFDYTADNPIDKIGQKALAFHRFGINNLPKSLAAAGARPVNANIPTEYYRASDDYNENKGLPRGFHGQMPIGQKTDRGQLTFDPMGKLPLGALVKSATRPSSPMDDKGSWVGELADDLKDVGLGLNPFIDALLTVSGQHGRSFAPGFLRASQPVNGVASELLDRPVDIEGFPKELMGNAQEHFTGQQPFPYQEYLLRKRQAELKALGKDPSQAGSQLGDQMGLEGMAGFIGIPGLKLLTPEEEQIRKDAKLAKALALSTGQPASQHNPTARAYTDLDPRDAMVRSWDKLSADERQRLFRDPEVRDQLTESWNFEKLSAAEKAQLLRDPEFRDKLLGTLSTQLHSSGTKKASHPNPVIARGQAAAARKRAYTAPTLAEMQGSDRKR